MIFFYISICLTGLAFYNDTNYVIIYLACNKSKSDPKLTAEFFYLD